MPDNVPPVWSMVTLVAACTVFLLSYLVFALGRFPGMKIDRTGGRCHCCQVGSGS